MTVRILLSILCAMALQTQPALSKSLPLHLIPEPQRLELLKGRLTVEPIRSGFLVEAKSAEAAERLTARLRESLDRVGWGDPGQSIHTRTGSGFSLVLGMDYLTAPDSTAHFPAPARAQGYELIVTGDSITIRAETEVGLFYGLMTLEQLFTDAFLQEDLSVPCLRILDWPALPMRGYSEDYGRNQLPTMEDQKRSIRNFARFKMNTYLFFIESDHFVYDFDPDLGKKRDRFTFDELREIVAYAKRYYIDVIPTVELLGHMGETLKHEKYKHLAEIEGKGDLCSTCEDSFELIVKMVGEIAPAFDSEYFHCGLDESWHIGKGRSKETVEKLGTEKVISDYYIRMNNLVHSYGKKMMMYADIALKYPKCLKGLPKDIVMMFWEYTPREKYDGIQVLKKAGFPVTTLSTLWDWHSLYPTVQYSVKNMDTMVRQSLDAKAIGHFVSSWGDPYRGPAGTNLSEQNNYGVAYCCSVSWNGKPIPIPDFSAAYTRNFFGAGDPALSEAFTLLARCQGDRYSQPRHLFQTEIPAILKKMSDASDEEVAFWQKLRDDADAAHRIMETAKTVRNADILHANDLGARMLTFTGDLVLLCRALSKEPTGDGLDRRKYAEAFRDLATRQRGLWDDYRTVYLTTNRPKNVRDIEEVWDWMHAELTTTAGRIDSGDFPEAD